jgi:hypothetical protein
MKQSYNQWLQSYALQWLFQLDIINQIYKYLTLCTISNKFKTEGGKSWAFEKLAESCGQKKKSQNIKKTFFRERHNLFTPTQDFINQSRENLVANSWYARHKRRCKQAKRKN